MPTTFLIDDDPDDQEFFCMAMKKANPTVDCAVASDCPRAIEQLKDPSFTPQLIFIDINMPRMDGVECLRNLREIPRLQQVPTYMYSTAADKRVVDLCLQLGADGFLQKQVSIADAKKDFEQILSKLDLT
jgi:CheY-like chemotaxis protein